MPADQTVRIDVVGSYRGGFSKAHRDLAALGRSARHATDDLHPRLAALGNASAVAGTALLVGVGAAMAIGAKAAIDFESSFAGVRKTLDGSEAQFTALARGIRDMALEVPISVHELNRIAELGGQLGVPIGAIEDFTRVIAMLGVTTNLEVDEAATGLARFMNVMGTSFSQVDALGSGLVDLGNNFATTESEILGFGTRLAGIGKVVGLTEGDVLGLAAAFTSLGEPVERGATAVQRTLVAMFEAVQNGGGNLELFAEVLGITNDEFAELFAQNPVEAFLQFEEGLNRITEAGGNTTGVLDDLGLGSQRTLGLLLKGASGYQLLRRGVEDSNEAIAMNLALNEEADKRFSTTASGITLMKNAFTDFRIELGQSTLGGVQNVARVLGELLRVLAENVDIFKEMMPLIIALASTKVIGKLGNGFFNLGIQVGRSTPILRKFHKGLTRVMAVSQALGFALSTAVIAIGAAATAMAINRAKARAYADSMQDLADVVAGLEDGTRTVAEVLEIFGQQLALPTGIFDQTIEDITKFEDSFIGVGQSLEQMLLLGIRDLDAFNEAADEGLAIWTDRMLAISRLQGETLPGAPIGVELEPIDPEDSRFDDLIGLDEFELEAEMAKARNYQFAIDEVVAAIMQLREEEARRRREALAADPLPFYGGPFGQISIGDADVDISDIIGDPEDAEKALNDILAETAEFGEDYAGEWQSILDTFNGQLTNWDSAWDEYETIARLSTKEILGSLGRYEEDSRRMIEASKFVFDNYGSFWFEFWAMLDEGARSGMAATLEELGPEEFRKQFDAFASLWGRLGQEALEFAFHVAPEGARRAMDGWGSIFGASAKQVGESVAEESDGWVDALLANFGVFLGKQQPEVSDSLLETLDGAIDSVNSQLAMNGLGIDFTTLTSGMDQIGLARLFHSMGFSWADSIALGFAAANLPGRIASEGIAAGSDIDDAFKHELENASPSKVFMRHGLAAAEGFAIGMSTGLDNMQPVLRVKQNTIPRVDVDVSKVQPASRDTHIEVHGQTKDLDASTRLAGTLLGVARRIETKVGNR